MFRKLILPIFAILGILLAIFMIYFSKKEPDIPKIVFPPPTISYKNFIAGSGIIEAYGENIDIGVPFPDLIEEVYVKIGEKVKKDYPLFRIDTRQLEARLKKATWDEKKAYTQFKDKENRFSYYKKLLDKRAVSEEKYFDVYFDMKIAKKEYLFKKAASNEIAVQIERSLIKAPMNGEILQVNVKRGEFANVNPFDKKPLLLFGDLRYFQVRVDIDEEDAWQIKKNMKATAFVRGNSDIKIDLEFCDIEPYVVAKRSLTGENNERVDTRVLQMIYRFKKDDLPVYVGQLLDVYIEVLKF